MPSKKFTEEEVQQLLEQQENSLTRQFLDEQTNSQDDNYNHSDLLPEPDNSRWELDPNDSISAIIVALERLSVDKNGRYYRPKHVKPYMNKEGISDIKSTLQSVLTKSIALGNISEREVYIRTIQIMESIVDIIRKHWARYDLDKSHFSNVISIIEVQVSSHLSRSKNEGERKYRAQKHQIRENYSHDEVNPNEISAVKM